jgi:hypothetical protein
MIPRPWRRAEKSGGRIPVVALRSSLSGSDSTSTAFLAPYFRSIFEKSNFPRYIGSDTGGIGFVVSTGYGAASEIPGVAIPKVDHHGLHSG